MSGLVGHAGLLLSSSGWSPAQLATPAAFWVDDGSAITESSGLISQWNDKTASAAHATQATSSRRPTAIVGGLNGRRIARFDGTDDWLEIPKLDTYRNVPVGWVFSVYKKLFTDPSGTHRVLLFSTQGTTNKSRVYSSTGRATDPNKPALAGTRVAADADAILTSATARLAWTMRLDVFNFSTATWSIYIDGQLDTAGTRGTTGNTENTDSSHVTIAAARDSLGGLGAWGDFDLAAMLLGNSDPAVDIDKLMGWAAWRYGLVANLPIGHPYKTSPPT